MPELLLLSPHGEMKNAPPTVSEQHLAAEITNISLEWGRDSRFASNLLDHIEQKTICTY